MNRKIIPALLVLALVVMACQIPSSLPNSVPPAAASTALPPKPADLTVEMLRNGTYFAPYYGRTVTLVNGAFSAGTGADKYSIKMLDLVTFGDLNGDGVNDATFIMVEDGGGSGQFESVIAVLNAGGTPTPAGYAKLGDRVQIHSLAIAAGQLNLKMLVQGPNDPMCCPSQIVKQTYQMVKNIFWLTQISTFTPDNQERSLIINSPVGEASVTNPFTINGSFTIAPFENTLSVRIYLPDETKVNESALTVDPGGVAGGPGKFSKTIDLSSAGITGTIIVQFLDVSAADGSTMALASVVVNIH